MIPEAGATCPRSSVNRTVHELFEELAAATPDAVAVLFQDQQLTYGQLNERANRLAHHLLGLGVSRRNLIGLCLERSLEVVVGMLGILKAGCAYVPLDPSYPDERLAFMLHDAAVPLVLAHRPTADRLARVARQTRILCLDANAARIAAEPAHDPAAGATAEDLVYVMYTSGSTGTPKGVLVGHRAVVRLVRDTDYCHFGPEEVFLHLAPLAFDASTFEIWGPLLNGGRLAVLPPAPPTPDEIAAAIRRYGVTTLWLTAGLFHLVVDHCALALAPLRQLVAGGDVLSPAHVGRALEAMRDGVLINGYGPTESTTFACCYRMKKGYRPEGAIPIGRPIANTTVHVLDERLQPAPADVPGELYIGGAGLAHGYLNNAELTREKFVPDLFSADPAARLYRTGDRVRRRADGNIEFLGRFDDQAKILGHRIEPGEIEAALRQHSEVRQTVVIAQTQPSGEKRLVAYVVASSGAFSADELKRHLADRLPPYMVPAQFVRIDRLPLTPNGKVDRSALPAPERCQPSEAAAGSPMTEMEETVRALWGRILHCAVGLEENFFDLGGSSLQLLELHAELNRMLGRRLPRTVLFEHVTVRALAGWLTGERDLKPALAQVQERAKRQKEAFTQRKVFEGNRE